MDNNLCLKVGLGMLGAPVVIFILYLGISSVEILDIGALCFGIVILAYIGTALFLIIKGCVGKK